MLNYICVKYVVVCFLAVVSMIQIRCETSFFYILSCILKNLLAATFLKLFYQMLILSKVFSFLRFLEIFNRSSGAVYEETIFA